MLLTDQEIKDNARELHDLYSQRADLDEKIGFIRKEFLDHMLQNELNTIEVAGMKITRQKRRKYQFDDITRLGGMIRSELFGKLFKSTVDNAEISKLHHYATDPDVKGILDGALLETDYLRCIRSRNEPDPYAQDADSTE